LTPEVKAKFTGKLEQAPPEFFRRKVKQVVCTDGLKLVCQDGSWVCYRLSGTEPVVRIYSEAGSEPELEKLSAAVKHMDLRVARVPKVRVLPSPEEGLRTLVEHAPQAEAWADRVLARLRPTLTALFGIRRRLATVAVAGLTIWLFVHVMFGANGMVVYRQKKAEYQSLQTEIGGLQRENDRSGQQIKALQTDRGTIEKTAREQLRYTRPGEVVFVVPEPSKPQRPETHSARK